MDEKYKEFFEVIEHYLHLPFATAIHVRCPYFNNKTSKIRGGLRAKLGKGTPEEIVLEAEMEAKKLGINLADLPKEKITEFLVHQRLGIDCSGFAYHALSPLVRKITGSDMRQILDLRPKNILSKIIGYLRPAERASVNVFAHPNNSQPVLWGDAQIGDFIIFLKQTPHGERNHLLLVTDTKTEQNGKLKITYTHALKWQSDGESDHGVRQGEIIFPDKNSDPMSAEWLEKQQTGEANETAKRAFEADKLELRRLNCL